MIPQYYETLSADAMLQAVSRGASHPTADAGGFRPLSSGSKLPDSKGKGKASAIFSTGTSSTTQVSFWPVRTNSAAVFGSLFPIDYITVDSGDTEEDHCRMVLKGFLNARAAHFAHFLGRTGQRSFTPVMGIYITKDFLAYRYLFAAVQALEPSKTRRGVTGASRVYAEIDPKVRNVANVFSMFYTNLTLLCRSCHPGSSTPGMFII